MAKIKVYTITYDQRVLLFPVFVVFVGAALLFTWLAPDWLRNRVNLRFLDN